MKDQVERKAVLTRANKKTLIHGLHTYWSAKVRAMMRERGDLTEDEKQYLFEKLGSMKDEKLKSIITGLFGWGDDDRAELETFLAAALQLFKHASPSAVRAAFQIVELQYLSGQLKAPPIPENIDEIKPQ